jgi:hypothetical protein
VIEVTGLDLALPEALVHVLSDDIVTALVADIAEAARSEWIRLVGENLHSTGQDYITGLQPVEVADGTASITLVGVLPNLLENGMSETDLHDTLLGPNVPISEVGEYGKHLKIDPKTGQVGFYRAIPFRHKVGNKGAGFGTPYQGHEAVADAAALGRQVYGQAKQLSPTTSSPYGGSQWGGRLPPGLAPKLKEHHATDIYSGMVRQRKTYEKATQSQYTTFRTISTGSPGWIRPATPGVHLAAQVTQFIAQIAPQSFSAYVEGMSK